MKSSIPPIVINWHITEACNFSCQYCYAHWNNKHSREIIHNLPQAKRLIQSIHQYFGMNEQRSVRVNIAGGEPLLYRDKVVNLLDEIRDLGMDASIITNGSYLDEGLIKQIASRVSVFGISLDSVNTKTNHLIGREDKHGEQLKPLDLALAFSHAKEINPNIQIKVNTVINSENYTEDFSNIIEVISPDKWKAFKVLPILNNKLQISDEQFGLFINKHSKFKSILQAEDNDLMIESYIMIDPLGRFYQNHGEILHKDYLYSPSILDVGIESAYKHIQFSESKFNSRYVSNAQ